MKTVAKEIQDAFEEKDIDGFYIWYHDNKQRLLEKEKQHIIDAYEKDMDSNGNLSFESGEQYYNETFS